MAEHKEENEEEKEASTLSSRVAWLLLGDAALAATPVEAFEKWLALVRGRCRKYRTRSMALDFLQAADQNQHGDNGAQAQSLAVPGDGSTNSHRGSHTSEMSLWERLRNCAALDIESSDFSWNDLSSLHHTEHSSSNDQSEDEMKALEVTVNSGGVVFFALFNTGINHLSSKEAAAVIKIASSRMATQSERLGYEFARWLGVRTPQARVVHNSSSEWHQIKVATEKAREAATAAGDEVGELTCTELLEALELSRCIFLMNYVHGSPLLETSKAFDTRESACHTAAALSRILMLDLVVRNEDRLPCRQLGWRGNYSNLLYVDEFTCAKLDALGAKQDIVVKRHNPRLISSIHKDRRANSMFVRLDPDSRELLSPSASFDYLNKELGESEKGNKKSTNFHIVAIDSVVPRRPPAGKRAIDHECYPKVVELILNNSEYAGNILYEISAGKLGFPPSSGGPAASDSCLSLSYEDMASVVHEFRVGFRSALRDLQGFHIFLLTLHQKLDGLFRVLQSLMNKNYGDVDKDDCGPLDSPSHSAVIGFSSPSLVTKSRVTHDIHADASDSEKSWPKSTLGFHESPGSASPISREHWSGRHSRGSGESRSLRLTMKLRDVNKFAKADAELSKELEQWNEMLRTDVLRLCQEHNFDTGFLEGNDGNVVVDAYELKVRIEHILERIALITDAANTERPSHITGNMFIGGALAARSVHTLQHLGITHILCLCSNEIGQSDSQFPEHFDYKNFSICDSDDENIGELFEEACSFIDKVGYNGGKVLVHCFEGRSRSATVILAYLMLRKGLTLAKAWDLLKKAHRRAQPNDGFARTLLELDRRLHGEASMVWQHKKPAMKVCPICGKNAGLSSGSLKLHLQKSHKRLSSGSVDSAMTIEIQKVLEGLKIGARGGSVSPTQKLSRSLLDLSG